MVFREIIVLRVSMKTNYPAVIRQGFLTIHFVGHDFPRKDFLEKIGREFHELLHEAATKHGVKDPAHEDDPNHNRYVGAAVAMTQHGLPRKAVMWYNRWALAPRHQPITLQKEGNPVLIRIETKAGHGSGMSTQQIIETITDQWSFLFANMGIRPYER